MNKLQFFIHNDSDARRIEPAVSLSGVCHECEGAVRPFATHLLFV